ncbi:hypothetical protein HELRODRAFT_192738 [Helobdella robusta]|uniref:Uncharacterized protein n=1 Tax=Helobdella robusta TaxID=6412 RepID=T1FU89_HELRO|nr:hypothetical protein HELRODRAFT_192738 [Helobdella robusta]ESO00111.1 hypothetical protein HELRODRAFT_192738 [Helobdella robusta]
MACHEVLMMLLRMSQRARRKNGQALIVVIAGFQKTLVKITWTMLDYLKPPSASLAPPTSMTNDVIVDLNKVQRQQPILEHSGAKFRNMIKPRNRRPITYVSQRLSPMPNILAEVDEESHRSSKSSLTTGSNPNLLNAADAGGDSTARRSFDLDTAATIAATAAASTATVAATPHLTAFKESSVSRESPTAHQPHATTTATSQKTVPLVSNMKRNKNLFAPSLEEITQKRKTIASLPSNINDDDATTTNSTTTTSTTTTAASTAAASTSANKVSAEFSNMTRKSSFKMFPEKNAPARSEKKDGDDDNDNNRPRGGSFAFNRTRVEKNINSSLSTTELSGASATLSQKNLEGTKIPPAVMKKGRHVPDVNALSDKFIEDKKMNDSKSDDERTADKKADEKHQDHVISNKSDFKFRRKQDDTKNDVIKHDAVADVVVVVPDAADAKPFKSVKHNNFTSNNIFLNNDSNLINKRNKDDASPDSSKHPSDTAAAVVASAAAPHKTPLAPSLTNSFLPPVIKNVKVLSATSPETSSAYNSLEKTKDVEKKSEMEAKIETKIDSKIESKAEAEHTSQPASKPKLPELKSVERFVKKIDENDKKENKDEELARRSFKSSGVKMSSKSFKYPHVDNPESDNLNKFGKKTNRLNSVDAAESQATAANASSTSSTTASLLPSCTPAHFSRNKESLESATTVQSAAEKVKENDTIPSQPSTFSSSSSSSSHPNDAFESRRNMFGARSVKPTVSTTASSSSSPSTAATTSPILQPSVNTTSTTPSENKTSPNIAKKPANQLRSDKLPSSSTANDKQDHAAPVQSNSNITKKEFPGKQITPGAPGSPPPEPFKPSLLASKQPAAKFGSFKDRGTNKSPSSSTTTTSSSSSSSATTTTSAAASTAAKLNATSTATTTTSATNVIVSLKDVKLNISPIEKNGANKVSDVQLKTVTTNNNNNSNNNNNNNAPSRDKFPIAASRNLAPTTSTDNKNNSKTAATTTTTAFEKTNDPNNGNNVNAVCSSKNLFKTTYTANLSKPNASSTTNVNHSNATTAATATTATTASNASGNASRDVTSTAKNSATDAINKLRKTPASAGWKTV